MDYSQRIKDLSNTMYYEMQNYSQITIDRLSELEDALNNQVLDKEELGAISYDISILLEAINPDLFNDIKALREMTEILNFVLL